MATTVYYLSYYYSLSLKSFRFKTSKIQFLSLKNLKEINLSGIEGICDFRLVDLPKCKITYPNLKVFLAAEEISAEKGITVFSITKDVYDNTNAAAFVNKYSKNLSNGYNIRTPKGTPQIVSVQSRILPNERIYIPLHMSWHLTRFGCVHSQVLIQ